jgi:hypothetical protein
LPDCELPDATNTPPMLQPDSQVPVAELHARLDWHAEPMQHPWPEPPHASQVPPDDGHTSVPLLHELPATMQLLLAGSQQPPFVQADPVEQHDSPVAPHAEQVVPVSHATALQQDWAQSAAVSALSPLGTQLTHAPVVVSQTSLPAQSALTVHEDQQAVALAQPKSPGQAEVVPPPHVPEPLHVPPVVS